MTKYYKVCIIGGPVTTTVPFSPPTSPAGPQLPGLVGLGQWRSVSDWSGNNEFRCFYEIGKTTKPKIGKLFAFDSLRAANNFTRTMTELLVILEGTGRKSRMKTEGMYIIGSAHNLHRLPSYWANPRESWIGHADIPKGTVLLESFKPMRVVYGKMEGKGFTNGTSHQFAGAVSER